MTTLTIPAEEHTHTAGKPHGCGCGCGCSETTQTCCRLDCVSRPRFFCGQMLTDQDLSALVDWTSTRLRLSRYRHGWGVVCGLRVQCDPKHHASVVVESGYAVDCCGDDIVVCEEAKVDLSPWCKPPVDPCAQFEPRQATPTYVDIGCLRIPVSELRILDLNVQYAEKPTDPQTALGRGSCHRDVTCEYTRVKEAYRFSIEEHAEVYDPIKSAADAWLADYQKCLAIIDEYLHRFSRYDSSPKGYEDLRAWLLKWLDAHPLHEFCFVRDCICNTEQPPSQSELVRWLFWIVQDCRNSFAHCHCYSCETNSGVPLARIWLHVTDRHCSVVRIDPYSPYRRERRPECWPAPEGYVNLAHLLWQRLPAALQEAADMGVPLVHRPMAFVLPESVLELRRMLDCSPIIDSEEGGAVLQYFNAGDQGLRVVGFCGPHVDRRETPPAGDHNRVDDLTLLPAIAKGRAEMLNAAGLTTFRQIAAMDREQLRRYLPKLADGPLDEIIKAAKELSGGRSAS